MIKIDKGVPITKTGQGAKRKYPFLEMKVGDSFFAPVKNSTISGSVNRMKITQPKWKFTIRAEGKGSRVWRVK